MGDIQMGEYVSMWTDVECIQRYVLAGDQQAFSVLVERYRAPIVAYCARQLHDVDEAESLAQEVFLHAFFTLSALRNIENFSGWLRGIARHQCQSWHRRNANRHYETLDENLPGGTDDFAARVDQLQMQQVMLSLPKMQQRVLVGKYLLGYSVEELAAQFTVSLETMRTRLRRAKQRFEEVYTIMASDDGAQPSAFTRRVLARIELVNQESGVIWPLYACLKANGSDRSLPYLSAIMGTAFELTVDECISSTGPTDVMDWNWWFSILPELGYEVTVFDAVLQPTRPTVHKSSEEEYRATQVRAWAAARDSLDRGVPVIAWMPITAAQVEQGIGCEYGLLVGYDREEGVYYVRLPWAPMYTVRWDGFGRMDPVHWFNMIVFGHARTIDYHALELKVLQRAIAHARGTTPGYGLHGYHAWITALETQQIDLPGSIRAARILREARAQAAAYLTELAERYPQASMLLTAAAEKYRTVAANWEEYPGLLAQYEEAIATDGDRYQQVIALVSKIRAREGEAIESLTKVVTLISE